MLKNTLKAAFAAALAGMALSSCMNGGANLKGHIELDRDSILVQTLKAINPKGYTSIDTVALENGNFKMHVEDTAALFVYISPLPKNHSEMMTLPRASMLLLPGDKISISGRLDDLTISGSELYDSLEALDGIQSLEKEYTMAQKELRPLYASEQENKDAIDSLDAVISSLSARLNAQRMDFVKNNPSSPAAAYMTLVMPAKESVEAYGMLDESLKTNAIWSVVDYIVTANRNNLTKKANWENMKPGVQAPDFKLRNLDGEYMTLASFKGKYVLLDFWGTWCGWCIKGIPDMKEYYAKYKDRIEFVGIDCRDTEEKWMEGVAKHELPWTNLYNGDGQEIVIAYGVQGYPTKIIIDPEGKIVEAFLGEDPALYKKLDELF